MRMKTFCLAIALLGAAGVAGADQNDGHRFDQGFHERESHDGYIRERFHGREAPVLRAPEIDAASVVVALTMLGGALAVLRGRRKSKTNS